MGRPKLALPWANGIPIIAHMVELFRDARVDPIVVVTGANREAIESCLRDYPVVLAHNPDHAASGMIGSVRIGLRAIQETTCEAALISPGDLPSMLSETLRSLIAAFRESGTGIVAPSYEGRRGHPVLLSRPQWLAILEMPEKRTLREFLRERPDDVQHVVVEDPGILLDLDLPEDYESSTSIPSQE